MFNKISVRLENIRSINDKASLETEIDILNGVANVNVDLGAKQAQIEFDDSKISRQEIFNAISRLGYGVEDGTAKSAPSVREHLFFVKGMHCASCEVVIEKNLLNWQGIKSVDAHADRGEVLVEYVREKPKADQLSSLFRKEGYVFSDEPFSKDEERISGKNNNLFNNFLVALTFIVGFLFLNRLGISGLVNVSSSSSLPTFFALGILAGISSCAALVGGVVLSMSKQWLSIYSRNNSTLEKFQPHFMFNLGRIVSYTLLGALLGIIGSQLQISLKFTSLLIVGISVMMVFLGLQMLGIKYFRKFQLSLPKSTTRYIANESNFKGKYMPFAMGALTFFLPCGFTITAQGLALLSGNAIQGALIMLAFVLGTAPTLLLIGLSSVKLSKKPHLAYRFSQVAGFLVLFFALFNINSQLNVLGYTSFSDLISRKNASVSTGSNTGGTIDNELPTVVNGKQLIKMNASASGYSPNYFKVAAGIPVRWEITDVGTSGCTNAVISQGLFSGQIPLTPGQTSIKEFTPTKTGKYKFSCWMGMISGVIEVVDQNSPSKASVSAALSQNNNQNSDQVIPSGAKGCGCGGGGGSSCGGGR